MDRWAERLATTALLASLSASALAQAAPASENAPAAVQPPGPEGREHLRELLLRRREVAEATRARLDDAIARMDRGETLDPEKIEEFRNLAGERPEGAMGRGRGPGEPEQGTAPSRGADRQGDRPRGPSSSPGAPNSAEETRRLRVFVDEHLPLLAERLKTIEKEDPEGPRRMLARLGPRLYEAMDAQGRSPALFELRVTELQQSFVLIESARRVRRLVETEGAESDAAKQARERFRSLAAEHYDTQVKMQELEVAELETKISALRAELDRKATNRDREIDSRIDGLLKGFGPDGDRPGRRPDRNREGDRPLDDGERPRRGGPE